MEIQLLSDIGKALDALRTPLEEADRIQALTDSASTPVFYTQTGTAIITPNSSCVIKLIGPDMGHLQYLRSLATWCPSLGVAGTVNIETDLFVSAFDYTSYNINFISQFSGVDWRDRYVASQFQTKFYRRNQIVLHSGEDLFVWTSVGITPGLTMAAVAVLVDFEESSGSKFVWEM